MNYSNNSNRSNIPLLMYHDLVKLIKKEEAIEELGKKEDIEELGRSDWEWKVSLENFSKQMHWLKEQGWKSISLSELKEKVEKETTHKTTTKNNNESEKLFVLTFDDGRKGVFQHAYPLLKELGFTATVFVVPQWMDGEEIPPEETYSAFMSWDELQELLRAGWEWGSHSFSHRNMAELPEDLAVREILRAEQVFLEKLGKKPLHFSYPFGKYTDELLNLVRENYLTGVSAQRGFDKSAGRYARQRVLGGYSLDAFVKLLTPPKLSVCLIIKNEEKFLGNCLNSVRGLADEIIVVDTGSRDKSKEIALSHGAKVFDFAWQDDFAAARNFSLQQATGDWILILDADEELAVEEHSKLKEALNAWEVEGFRVLTKNYSNDSGTQAWQPLIGEARALSRGLQGWFPSIKVRLFQNKKNFIFLGKVHEIVPEDSFLTLATLPISIDHYGALRGDSEEKTKMHLSLTLQKIREGPENAKAYFELGVQYKNLARLVEAESALRKSFSLSPSISSLLNLALVLQKQGKISEAIEKYEEILAKTLSPKDSAEANFGLGYCYYVRGNLEEAAKNFAQAILLQPHFVEAYVNLAAVREKQGKLKEAYALLEKALYFAPQHPRAHHNRAVVLEKAGNLPEALKSYRRAQELGYLKGGEVEKKAKAIEEFLEYSS